jgi:hypothetical protein
MVLARSLSGSLDAILGGTIVKIVMSVTGLPWVGKFHPACRSGAGSI